MEQAEVKAIIEEGTHHRGWISNCYAQIEFLLGDLINRSRQFPEYSQQTQTISHSAPKRVKKVRAMLAIEGPLSPFAGELLAILDAFEDHHQLRNLLAHGFCEFHYTSDGDSAFNFRKFERGEADQDVLIQRHFRLVDLHYHRGQLVSQAQTALIAFMQIHAALGWGDALGKDFGTA